MITNLQSSGWGRKGSRRLEDVFDAWLLAAHDAREALHAWVGTAPRERHAAYTVYRAALDREEHAADVLRSVTLGVALAA
jgi:hypothetical protein